MTVTVDESAPSEFGQRDVAGFFLQKLAQQECLFREPSRSFIVREEVGQFIAEHRRAAGLENNDGNARLDLGLQHVERLQKQVPRPIQHAPVVKRAPATQLCARQKNAEPGGLENIDRSLGRVRQKEIVKRVWPQKDWRSIR